MSRAFLTLEITQPHSRHSVFATEDFQSARSCLTSTFKPFKFNIAKESAKQTTCSFLNLFDLNVISISYIRLGRELQIVPGPLEDFYLLQIPVKGFCHIEYGGKNLRIDENCWSIVSPLQPLRMTWSPDCELLELKIRQSALESTLAELSGIKVTKPIEFNLEFQGAAGFGHSLMELLVYICSELENPSSLLELKGTRSRLEGAILSLLLESQQHNYTEQMQPNKRTFAQGRVDLAVEFILNHASESLTLSDIASAAGLSVRSLSSSFPQCKNMTPIEYLKKTRFDYVRAALLMARGSDVTVTDVAYQWGLNHVGRFASEYRRRFGEYPSVTLQGK